MRPSCSSTSAITTCAPSPTKPRAWLAPKPRAPPVTITVRLTKRFMIVSFHDHQSAHPHVRPFTEVSLSPLSKSQTRRFCTQTGCVSVLVKFIPLRCVSRRLDLFAALITNGISSTQGLEMPSPRKRVGARRPYDSEKNPTPMPGPPSPLKLMRCTTLMTAPRSSAGVATVISVISPTKMSPWPMPEPTIASTAITGLRVAVATTSNASPTASAARPTSCAVSARSGCAPSCASADVAIINANAAAVRARFFVSNKSKKKDGINAENMPNTLHDRNPDAATRAKVWRMDSGTRSRVGCQCPAVVVVLPGSLSAAMKAIATSARWTRKDSSRGAGAYWARIPASSGPSANPPVMHTVAVSAATRCARTWSETTPTALSLKAATPAAEPQATPRPCATRAANTQAVPSAITNKTSPTPNEISAPRISARGLQGCGPPQQIVDHCPGRRLQRSESSVDIAALVVSPQGGDRDVDRRANRGELNLDRR